MLPRQLDELARVPVYRSLWGSPGDRHSSPAAEVEQPFVAQVAQCSKDGVAVDAEDRREVAGGREPFAGLCLTLGNRAPDLTGHLPVQLGDVFSADLDAEQWCYSY